MPVNELNEYGDFSKSRYENVEAVSRIGTAEMKLAGDFQLYHKEILQNFYRLAGHIYSSADLQKLAIENRPDFEWNLFLPIILSIIGNFKQNLPGLDINGITKDDNTGAELQEKLMKYYLYQANDITYEFAIAFLYAIVGRIGWLKTSWTHNKDDEGMVDISWYDPLRIKFDTNFQRRDTSDMRFISDSGWYDPEEIINIYAKKKPDLRSEIYEKGVLIAGESTIKSGRMKRMLITWAERFLNASIQYGGRKQGFDQQVNDVRYGYSGNWYNGDGRFKVIDWYEKRMVPKIEITDLATGEERDISEEIQKPEKSRNDSNWFDREKLIELKKQYIEPKIIQSWDEIIWQTSVVPAMNLVLHDAPQKHQNKLFKFIPVMCYNFNPDVMETKSIMDHITDPVSSYNMRRNTLLTYVMRAAHGGWIAEQGAIAGFEDDFASNEIGGIKKVRDGALTKKAIMEIKPGTYPEALRLEAESEKEDIIQISGSTPNFRGQKQSNDESGILFKNRVAQSDIMQEWISENAQASLVLVARNLQSIGQRYLTMPRTLLILQDESDPEWLQINQYYLNELINDVSYGKYNIKISKSPYGQAAQEREFQIQLQMAEWLLKVRPEFVDPKIIIEASPLKNKQKWLNFIQMAEGNIGQQMAQIKQQEEMQRQLQTKQTHLSLVQAAQGIAKAQLENYQLSDSIVSGQLSKNLSNNGSPAARQSASVPINQ